MSTIEINTPDGKILQLNAPEDATADQIHQAAIQASQHYVQANQPTMSPTGLMDNLKMAGKAFLGGSSMDTTNEMAQAGANQTGEDIATSKLGQKFPNIGAGLGTTVAISPMLAGMALPSIAAREAAQAGDLGIAGRVVSGPGRAEAGAMIGNAEKAVGVNPDVTPTLKDVSSNLGLKTANTKQYMNALMERLKSGEEMGPQALSQHHKMITEILSKENSGLAKLIGITNPRTIGAPAIAQATKLNQMLVEQLNEAAPGREAAAAMYRAAMIRKGLYKKAIGAGLSYVGGSPLLKALMKTTDGGQ